MARRPIDWRDEFSQLDRYMRGDGGFVRIFYPGEIGAAPAFLDTLKTYYEHYDDLKKRRTLQIDHAVYSVRYLEEVRSEFIRKVNFNLDVARDPKLPAATLNVVKDVEAKGNVSASVKNVTQNNYFNENELDLISQRRKWLGSLMSQMEAFLTDGGRFLIVLNTGPVKDQDEFWRYAWRDGLEKLMPLGLVLIQMVDTSQSEEIHALAPDLAFEMYLPTTLGLDAQKCAAEDITDILMDEFDWLDKSDARARAESLVHANRGDIPKLHRHVAGLLLQLRHKSA